VGEQGLQDLLERGVRWSAGDWALQPKPKLPSRRTARAGPRTTSCPRRGARPARQITRIPQPLPAADSAKHLVAPAGVEPKLFAAEPKIFKPITMAWDERGRLWVAETLDYPNELQERGKGRDRISILRTRTSDGQADKFTVFADKLSIPTSLCFANGGVIVAQAPDMLFLKDTTGTTRPTSGGCCSPAGRPTTPTPARATCGTARTTGCTASSGTPGSTGSSAASRRGSPRASGG
jgi:hypothetical protein